MIVKWISLVKPFMKLENSDCQSLHKHKKCIKEAKSQLKQSTNKQYLMKCDNQGDTGEWDCII